MNISYLKKEADNVEDLYEYVIKKYNKASEYMHWEKI